MTERERLPVTRAGQTHKVVVTDAVSGDDWELYLTVNRYEDGRVGELFASIGLNGSTLQGMLDGWAILLSVALQHGAPLPALVEKFKGTSFSPSGRTDDPAIATCSSLFDYVVRHLEGLTMSARNAG